MPWLSEQLDALAREQPPFDWEVVIADNGSGDDSAQMARSYTDRLDITVLERPDRLGAAAARNAAVAASGGRTLIFLDADDVIGPGYLQLMHDAIEHFGFAAARVDGISLNPEWASTAVRATADSDSDLAPDLIHPTG